VLPILKTTLLAGNTDAGSLQTLAPPLISSCAVAPTIALLALAFHIGVVVVGVFLPAFWAHWAKTGLLTMPLPAALGVNPTCTLTTTGVRIDSN
jgi:hypothetical protein